MCYWFRAPVGWNIYKQRIDSAVLKSDVEVIVEMEWCHA